MAKILLVDKEKVSIVKIKTLALLLLLQTLTIIPIFIGLISLLEGQLLTFDITRYLNSDLLALPQLSLMQELRYYFNLLFLLIVSLPTIFGLISTIYLNFVYSDKSFNVKHVKNVLVLIDLGVTVTILVGAFNFIQLYNSGFIALRSLDQFIFSLVIAIVYFIRK
jgi:hypothetical protein